MGQYLEELVAGISHPNPSVKKEVVMCFVRFFQQTKQLPDRSVMKPIVEANMKAMDDSDKDVREAAAECLATVMKLFGERSMLNYMEQLDKIKQDKVRSCFEKVVINVKIKPAAPAAAPAKKAAPKAVVRESEDAPPARSGPVVNDQPKAAPPSKAAAPAHKPAASSSAAAKGKALASSSTLSASSKKAGASSSDEVPSFSMSEDQSQSRAAELLSEELREKLSNSNWKLRLEGCEELAGLVAGQSPEEIEAEVLVRALQRKPGWKDANIQVQSKVFEVIASIASKAPSFNRACAAVVIPGQP